MDFIHIHASNKTKIKLFYNPKEIFSISHLKETFRNSYYCQIKYHPLEEDS